MRVAYFQTNPGRADTMSDDRIQYDDHIGLDSVTRKTYTQSVNKNVKFRKPLGQ